VANCQYKKNLLNEYERDTAGLSDKNDIQYYSYFSRHEAPISLLILMLCDRLSHIRVWTQLNICIRYDSAVLAERDLRKRDMQNWLTHENPTQPMASESISASIDGYELPAGKYAWNLGCCQCVICSRTQRKRILMIIIINTTIRIICRLAEVS